MAISLSKAKRRSSGSHYITFPNQCLAHANFKKLSGLACKMLFEFGSQFKAYTVEVAVTSRLSLSYHRTGGYRV